MSDDVTYRAVNFNLGWTLTKLNEPFVALVCPHCEHRETVATDDRGELPWDQLRAFMRRHLEVTHGAPIEAVPAAAVPARRASLLRVVQVLSETYTDEGIAIWLTNPNRNLGGERPVDLIRQHATDRVLAAAERIEGGI